VVDIAVECERLGFDSVWVSDHIVFDLAKYGGSDELLGSLEPLGTLAAISGHTSSIRLGTMVLCNEFRHPLMLAKQAVTIPRLELGMGAGWYEREFTVAGLPYPSTGTRIARLTEAVALLRMAFSGEPVTFDGRHYSADGFVLGTAVDTTIWIGGKGDRMMRLTASFGEGWNAAWFQDVEAYKERAALLGDAKVKRSIGQYAKGSAQEMVDRLHAFAAEGVEHAVMCFSEMPFGLDDPDDLASFAQEVLPHVH
jgi:alkanesulfonate monooxygenase SsuD/methylene tetrahydromethanopterin reductase-like flavin-dependent oxidoreductase (luciferase family)